MTYLNIIFIAFLLSCSYSASFGGLASMIGTETNAILKGYLDDKYSNNKLNFLTFSLFTLPIAIVMIIFTWIWLVIRYLPKE
jgi:solute carrier family 13 (sodium-dependent dicarboxylate transporter), member 2/3/5